MGQPPLLEAPTWALRQPRRSSDRRLGNGPALHDRRIDRQTATTVARKEIPLERRKSEITPRIIIDTQRAFIEVLRPVGSGPFETRRINVGGIVACKRARLHAWVLFTKQAAFGPTRQSPRLLKQGYRLVCSRSLAAGVTRLNPLWLVTKKRNRPAQLSFRWQSDIRKDS